MDRDDVKEWESKLEGLRVTYREELFPLRVGGVPRVWRRIDRWLDERIGFYPLAIRVNLRFGFHRERVQPALVVSNIQMQAVVPALLAAGRAGLPLVGYIASWDHTVGKGVIWPRLGRY